MPITGTGGPRSKNELLRLFAVILTFQGLTVADHRIR